MEAELTGEWLRLVSLDPKTPPDTTIEVDRLMAARALVEKTHRLATPEEIAADTVREAEQRLAIIDLERRRVAALFPFQQLTAALVPAERPPSGKRGS